ncbi:MAG: c-type cytochrome domain-containing protein, partial [Pirellulaceae bacterium]
MFHHRIVQIVLCPALLLTVLAGTPGLVSGQETKTTYDDQVKAVLRQRCASCHGPDKKSGDLDVTNFTSLMLGGSSGSVIEPGDPDMSYLYSLVTHDDEPVMPPSGKIPQAEIDLIKTWIESGALENQGSRAVMRKPSAVAMGDNPLVRPEVVAQWPRTPLEPAQYTERNPVAASIATSPWAPIAAIAGKNQVLLYDTESLQLTGVLPFPEGSVNVVRFSRSGSILLAAGGRAGSSGVVVLWDVSSGDRISTIGEELDAVLAADISPDHSLVAMGGTGRVVNVYSTATGEIKFTLR